MDIPFAQHDDSTLLSAFSREVKILGLVFATSLFFISSFFWGLAGIDPFESAIWKMMAVTGDVLLAYVITLVLWRMRHQPLGVKAVAAIVMSLIAAPLSGMNVWGLHMACVYPEPVPFDREHFVHAMIFTTSELFGWSCLYLAIQYSAQTRETERHLARLQQQATSAQLRALRYQVNPHFLFNTLNAISGLIEEGQEQPANEMVLRLAAFLRTTLSLDPLKDLTLEEELTLQMVYLGIEQTRFSDRLTVRSDIDPQTREARVPALVLQPLIENALKHGVAKTPGRAELLITTRILSDSILSIEIENSVPVTRSEETEGLGIGLTNVAERLATRYSAATTSCTLSEVCPGRVRVQVRMPFEV
ncbi:sensor histidine kinase [Arenibacterium sp. LLYu02]|uniref:sensor histidine kinase n=1 Tax=Arenibacterium sp. LLYu02 TaxID=3404132 RepID=UPI003B226DE1